MNKLRVLLPLLTLAVLWQLAIPPRAAASNVYGFNMVGPNASKDPSSGSKIVVAGGGSFDTVAGTVVASGSFAEFDASGSVIAHGSWKATAFVSFVSYGGPSPGFQGGQLMLTVTLFPMGGPAQPSTAMSVTCLVGSPPAGAEEGVTVANFTVKTGPGTRGATLFHLNQ